MKYRNTSDEEKFIKFLQRKIAFEQISGGHSCEKTMELFLKNMRKYIWNLDFTCSESMPERTKGSNAEQVESEQYIE